MNIKLSVRNIVIFVSIVLFFLLLWYFKTIVIYLISAGVVSLIGKPIMSFLRKFEYKKFRIPSPMAALVAIALIISCIMALSAIFIPLIFQQFMVLSNLDYIKIAEALKQPIEQINNFAHKYHLIEDSSISVDTYLINQVKVYLSAGKIWTYANSIVSFSAHFFVAMIAISFISFFFLQDEKMFFNIISSAAPSSVQHKVMRVLEHCRILLTDYFIGLIKQNICFALFISIGLSIVGIKNAILIGFIAGILNFIPYIGAIMAGMIALTMGFGESLDLNFVNDTLPKLGWIIVVFGISMSIDHLVTSTYFASNSVKAHPIEIFIVILMGGQLAGILGMFLAIPSYSILRILAKEFLSEFSFVRKLTDDLNI